MALAQNKAHPTLHRPGISFAIVLLTTFVSFCAFYAPQPLLPLLSSTFGVSASKAALLITITFLILCVAPLLYGLLLERISAKPLLVLSTALLGVLQFLFTQTENFDLLLLNRTSQGLLFPAIFTAAVTYCSRSADQGKVAARVSLYIATTIVGGLTGRLLSGYLASLYNWQFFFKLLAAGLLCCSVILLLTARDSGIKSRNESAGKSLFNLLKKREFISGFLVIFTTFFAFSATLNALPFRMVELQPDISPARISLVYAGYSIGVVIAANASRLAAWAGGEINSLGIALFIFVCGVALQATPSIPAVIAFGFLTAGGMFLIHSTLSGYLNNLQAEQAGLVNGLYISLYYGAGACGSILPLWIYEKMGWNWFIGCLTVVACSGFVALASMKKSTSW